MVYKNQLISIFLDHNLHICRSVVIHKDSDDNGLSGHNDSLTISHSGKILCCDVIGYSKKIFQ